MQILAKRFFTPLACLGAALFLTSAPQAYGQPAAQDAAATAQPAVVSTPELFQVVDPAALQLGTIMDFAKRDITITLRNIHSEPVHIERIRVTCSCLSLAAAPPATLLKSQEDITFTVKLDAAEIKPGPFTRMVLVEVKERDITLVYINGTVQSMFSFTPGQILDLGTFAGRDVPWERSFAIASKFPAQQPVSLQPPADDELFSYVLLTDNPQVFKLTVRPKLPLPAGKVQHQVQLPVTGVDNYGPVVLAIYGLVTGWWPVLENNQLHVALSEHKPGEPIVKTLRLVLHEQTAAPQGKKSLAAIRHDHGHHQAEDNPNAIATEELASDSVKQIAFWEAIAKDITARLPPAVSMATTAQADSLLVSLSFPPDFFARRRRQIIPFSYGKNSCGMLTITARP
ncbi:MAG: DUF1573 domain-containing protein [Lentisphaeria bacterium]|nr:DUF1573 domain-containing protein [Lentisphaeria bacterium]